MKSAIQHEVVHACLADLPLPLWLDEGIAQLAEETEYKYKQSLSFESKRAAELVKFWREHDLRRFWWGDGFDGSEVEQWNCYQLAKILFHQIMSEYRSEVSDFVRRADSFDAGESAAREVLGVGLTEIASWFLGQGDWEPVPHNHSTFHLRGYFHLMRDEYDQAIADLDRAIQFDERIADTFVYRGLAKYHLNQFSDSKADFEQALEIDPINIGAANSLAWILATDPNDEFRDGEQAVKLADGACEQCGYGLWYCVGTLGAAYAEVGDFEQARNFAEESLRLAPEDEQDDCRERLRSYEENRAWRELIKPKQNGEKQLRKRWAN